MASSMKTRRSAWFLRALFALSVAACGEEDTTPAGPGGYVPGLEVPPGDTGAGGTGGLGGTGSSDGTGGPGVGTGTPGGGTGGDAGLPVVLVDAGAAGMVPAPPPFAIKVPAYEQPKGDPELGYDYLINGQYQRLGPDLFAFKAAAPKIAEGDRLPGRKGENKDLSYMFNAAKGDDGGMRAAVTCLGCHATHLQGKLIVGLGRPNRGVRLDDVNILGIALANPLALGASTDTLARLLGGVAYGVMDVFPYLAAHRDAKTLKWTDAEQFKPDAGVQGWVDIPAWWRTKKKNAIYSNGVGRGVQGNHMSFMSVFSVKDTTEAADIEKNFVNVAEYLRSLEPPKFPGKIDDTLAKKGEQIFFGACATCHGTYGENWYYPNVIIPYNEVGTDPSLAKGHWMAPAVDWYMKSWYARDGKSWLENIEGYYAPPLDGIWATAPFFHNGSVPTLDGVIDPKKRPATWTSNMGADDYDLERVGWKDKPFDADLSVDGSFGTFNTNQVGYSNKGHTYGAHLSADEQKALLEYLKTL